MEVDGKTMVETPALFNGDKAWGVSVKIPAGARKITLAVADIESRITDPHGHADWLNAGFTLAA